MTPFTQHAQPARDREPGPCRATSPSPSRGRPIPARKRSDLGLALLLAASLGACGGGGGGSGGAGTTSTTHTLSGGVVAGATVGARVELFAATPQGAASGAALASTTSGADGSYTLSISNPPAGPFVLLASGGSYASELDGSPQSGATLRSLLAALSGNSSAAWLTPLTTLQTARAQALLAAAGAGGSTTPTQALDSARGELESVFGSLGLGSGQALSAVAPDFSTGASGTGAALSVRLGVIEQLARNLGVTGSTLVNALASDLSDGTADGRQSGTPVSLGTSTLPPSTAGSLLTGAALDYAGLTTSVHARAGIDTHATAADLGALLSSASAGAGSASSTLAQAASSGAIAALGVTVDGVERSRVYFAAREDGLISLDVSDADPARWSVDALVTLNTSLRASLGGRVGGVAALSWPLQGRPALLAYEPGSATVVLLNMADASVLRTATLTLSQPAASVEGNSTRIAAAAADAKRGWIWLATVDGLIALDGATLAEKARIAQPSGHKPGANLGIDIANDLLLSPSPDGQGLVVYNLATRSAYVLASSAWAGLAGNQVQLGTDGSVNSCSSADVLASLCSMALDRASAAALDRGYKVAVIGNAGLALGNAHLGLLTYATPAGPSATFAPGRFVRTSLPVGLDALSGVTVEPLGHYLFSMNGFAGGTLAVGQIADPTASASWAGLSALKTSSSAFTGAGLNAQGLGAARVNGKSWGWALRAQVGARRNYQLLAVDLAAVLAAPAGADGVLSADPLGNAALVRRIDY